MKQDEQRAEALRLFRLINGHGDSGNEAEFNCRSATEQSGWMRLAAEIVNLKSLLQEAALRISEHHAEQLCAWDGLVCPVCSQDDLFSRIDNAVKRPKFNPKDEQLGDLRMQCQIGSLHKEQRAIFQAEIKNLINRCCMENASDTPDFILAQYLNDCLVAFDKAVKERERWYYPKRLETNEQRTI